MGFNPFFFMPSAQDLEAMQVLQKMMSGPDPAQTQRDIEALDQMIAVTEKRDNVKAELLEARKKYEQLATPVKRPDYHTSVEQEFKYAEARERGAFIATENRKKIPYWVLALLSCPIFILLAFFGCADGLEGAPRGLFLSILIVGSLALTLLLSLFLYAPHGVKGFAIAFGLIGIGYVGMCTWGVHIMTGIFLPLVSVAPYLGVFSIALIYAIIERILLRGMYRGTNFAIASLRREMEEKRQAALARENAAYAQALKEKKEQVEAALADIAKKEKALEEAQGVCRQVVTVKFTDDHYSFEDKLSLGVMQQYLREGRVGTLEEANQLYLKNTEEHRAQLRRESAERRRREEEAAREAAYRRDLDRRLRDLQRTADEALEEERRRADEAEKARRELERIRREL